LVDPAGGFNTALKVQCAHSSCEGQAVPEFFTGPKHTLVRSPPVTAPPDTPEPPRRAGRPRLSGPGTGQGDPVDEILGAAGRLFGEQGVGATTMTQLAKAVGLRQSSLYYWFASKEEVVAALVSRANVVPLEVVARIEAQGGPPAVRLYRFVCSDVVALCEMPFDINEVHRIASRERERFRPYWDERATLERRIAAIVRAGVEDGSLRQVDARLTALTILANDEGVQNWYRLGSRRSADSVGRALADLVVGGLLCAPSRLESVQRGVERLEAAARQR
jgi:TetR/AcrR family transcriptional regulator